jgi:hypothetical protein
MTIVPFVLLATPLIRRLTAFAVHEEPNGPQMMNEGD